MSEYKFIRTIRRRGKEVVFFLKEGLELNFDDIYDVEIFPFLNVETKEENNGAEKDIYEKKT